MPAQLEFEPSGICVLRISGTLKSSEFSQCQNDLAKKIEGGLQPRLRVIGDHFEGWQRGTDWNDLDFMIAHQ